MSVLALGLFSAGAFAAELPQTHLKVVGGLGGVSQYKQLEEPFWTREIEKDSGGRVTAEVAAFDEIGLRGPEVLQLMRLGVISFGTASLSNIASEDPEAAGLDLVGLNPDIQSLRRNAEAYEKILVDLYRERYGIEVLSFWTYPGQVIFCNKPIDRLSSLKGLKVRTVSIVHSDFVEALGGVGVTLPFSNVIPALRKGVVDCAITGTLSGNLIKLHEVTTHIYGLILSWGPEIFAANLDAWRRLDPAVREFVRAELHGLADRIWDAAARETEIGFACNTGQGECRGGFRGHLTLVPVREDDQNALRQILKTVIVPRWAARCGRECVDHWNATIGRNVGIDAVVH
jgi:TRAP-type C4-dicarboxylate transport system substrate-binding protein